MAGLYYYLRGAGDDTAKKTVVIRFTHNGNFERVTKTKVAEKDFDATTGLVKMKVDGAAELNKEIDFVRSRFLDVLRGIAKDKLELNLDTFKARYRTLENQLEEWSKDSHKRKVRLSYNALADDLYQEIARLEGELEEARADLKRILYPNADERLLTNVFKRYVEASRQNPLAPPR